MHTTELGTAKDTATPFGWCDSRDDHDGRFDHRRAPSCRNFISDAEHTQRLLREAREHDRHTAVLYPNGTTNPAAAYVADYRPY